MPTPTQQLNSLEQATAFRPFGRQLVFFSQIAGRASQDYKVYIVPWTGFRAGDGYCVIKMVDICSILASFEFISAIVTGIALIFQFISNLLRIQCTFNSAFLHITFLPTSPSPCKRTFMMKLIPLFSSRIDLFSMCFTMALVLFAYRIFVYLIILIMVFDVSMVIHCTIFTITLSTARTQATSRMFPEEFKRCGEVSFALRAALQWYHIIHSKESFPCYHSPGCLPHRRATIICSKYTIKPPEKQDQGVYL